MPLQNLDEYIAQQQEKSGTEFLSRLQASGTDVAQYKQPDGSYRIPIAQGYPDLSAGGVTPDAGGPIQRGLLGVGSDLATTAAMGSELIGAEGAANFFSKKAHEYASRAAAMPSAMPDIESIKSIGDVGTYVWERFAENVPTLASLLIPGSAAGLLARGLSAAGKTSKALALLGEGGEALAAARAAQIGKRVGTATAFGVDAAQQVGESAQGVEAAGGNVKEAQLRVIGTGLGKAFLDFLPIFAIAKTMGISEVLEKNIISRLTEKGYIKRVIGNAGILAATEVPTEVAQEAMDIALERSVTQTEGQWTEEDYSRLKNAAAGALAVGAGLAPFAAFGKPRIREADVPEVPDGIKHGPEISMTIPNAATSFGGMKLLPGGKSNFYVDPAGNASKEQSAFDSANFYDPKTGEMKITGDEIRKALQESAEKLNYDPMSDSIYGMTYERTWKSLNPSWTSDGQGGAVLGNEAKVTMTPNGFQVTAPSGYFGTYPTMEQAMLRGEEFLFDRTPKVSIMLDGLSQVSSPLPGERIAANQERAAKTPTVTGQAMIQIDEAQTAATKRPDDFQEIVNEDTLARQLDPGLQKLLEERADILENSELYRNNGTMSKAGARQLYGIEGRIEAYARKIGIPNPLSKAREYQVAGDNVEGKLGAIAAQEEQARQAPQYKNLSPAESALFEKLQEKELLEGLTENEYGKLEQLIARQKGDTNEGVYRQPTKEELEEIQKDLNDVEQIMAEEISAAKKKGRKYHLDGEGNYLFSRSAEGAVTPPKFVVTRDGDGYSVRMPGKGEVARIHITSEGKYHVGASIPNVGAVDAMVRGGEALQVYSSEVNPEAQGKGFGLAMYQALAQEATRRGLRALQSDTQVSLEASRMYEGLERRGYEVKRNFTPEEMAQGERSDDTRPLFEVNTLKEATGLIRRAVAEAAQPRSTLSEKMRTKYPAMSLEAVVKAIAPVVAGLKIKPILEIKRVIDFPEHERAFARKSAGFIDLGKAGKVTLVLDNLFSAEQAKRVLVHEMIAHYGLRAFLEPAELQAVLKEVLAYRAKEIRANAQSRGELGKFDSKFGTDLQLNLRDAEEFIASKMEEAWIRHEAGDKYWARDSLWEKPGDRTFVERMIAFFRRIFRKLGLQVGREKWTDEEIVSLLKDTALFLSGKITGRNTVGVDAHWRTSRMRAAVGPQALGDVIPNMNSFSEVWGAKMATMFLTPLQISERYNTPGASTYMDLTQKWWARKRDLTVDAVNIAENWQGLPKREVNKLAPALFEIDAQSEALGRRLTDAEVSAILKANGVLESTAALYTRIDKSFRDMLDKLQRGLEFSALMEHAQDRAKAEELLALWKQENHAEFFAKSKQVLGNLEVGGRLSEIQAEFNQLRSRNYFPHMRFGRYAIYVRAREDLTLDGRDYKGPRVREDGTKLKGQITHFETFESYAARQSRLKDLVKEFPTRLYDIGTGIVSDAEFAFLGMPPSLYETLRGKLKLTEEQTEALKEIYFTKSPGRAFLKHMVKRKGVNGFSQDALRVYATYMMNASNHIARVEYHRDMGNALTELRNAGSEMGDVAGLVREYFAKHFEYIMNPENDWAALRSVGFLWYLGFNVKSALVNLTQIPMVAYPYLASVYGDARTIGALNKAYGTVVRLMRGRSVLDDATQVDLNRAIREGVIDQAQATELASIAETPVLQRLLPTGAGQKLLSDMAYYGSFLFRHGEKFNRHVAFLAARELALQKGLRGEDVYLAARKAVQTTMFEYSKWNRPEFMRGKKSVFFLFWNYMQHLQYLAWGGEGKGTALRIWAMLLLTAGIQGLPFAEDILDLLDFGSTKAKEALGSKDPHTDLRLQLRELAQTMTDNPDTVMHGLARNYGLGPLHLLQLLGVPIPGVDTSASLSAGRVVPGVQPLLAPSRNPDQQLGQAVMDGLGPIAGIGYNFWKVLTARDPDTWKVWERAMPTAMKSASQAVRRWDTGEESFRGGGAVAKFDPHNWDHRGEIVANALGFQPTRVSERYEARTLQEDMRQYWLSRRALVMENYAYAYMSHDPEAMADARAALARFNSEAISPKLKISTDTIEQSMKQRLRKSDLRTEGLPSEIAFVPLYKRVNAAFPEIEETPYPPSSPPVPSPQQ